MAWDGIPAESSSAKRPLLSVGPSRSMLAVPSGDEDGHAGSPSGLCHTHERETGLDARNHRVSGAEPTIGPDLSERVEQVRAALPGADRTRFEQELDQAFGPGQVDPGSGAARQRRRGLAACGLRSSARWPAVGGDRGPASAGC